MAQFAIRSAWMLGAGPVIAIDMVPERLEMARQGRPRRSISEGKGLRPTDGDDQGPRPRQLHRRGRGRGSCRRKSEHALAVRHVHVLGEDQHRSGLAEKLFQHRLAADEFHGPQISRA